MAERMKGPQDRAFLFGRGPGSYTNGRHSASKQSSSDGLQRILQADALPKCLIADFSSTEIPQKKTCHLRLWHLDEVSVLHAGKRIGDDS